MNARNYPAGQDSSETDGNGQERPSFSRLPRRQSPFEWRSFMEQQTTTTSSTQWDDTYATEVLNDVYNL